MTRSMLVGVMLVGIITVDSVLTVYRPHDNRLVATLHWRPGTLECIEVGKPITVPVIIRNDSATPIRVLGFLASCDSDGCIRLNEGTPFPAEIRTHESHFFELMLIQHRQGAFRRTILFYTDIDGQGELVEQLTGMALIKTE